MGVSSECLLISQGDPARRIFIQPSDKPDPTYELTWLVGTFRPRNRAEAELSFLVPNALGNKEPALGPRPCLLPPLRDGSILLLNPNQHLRTRMLQQFLRAGKVICLPDRRGHQ